MNLNELSKYKEVDCSDMLSLLTAFPDDVINAADFAPAIPDNLGNKRYNLIATLGMGGSGIAGKLLSAIATPTSDIPILNIGGYELPRAVSDESLVIALSYSGNTAETLSLTQQAIERGARIIGITSGGELENLVSGSVSSSGAANAIIKIPGGRPPRTAIAYLNLPCIEIGARLGICDAVDYNGLAKKLKTVRESIAPNAPNDNPAISLAQRITQSKRIHIYGSYLNTVVAVRLRAQLAENSKIFSSSHAFPECCHNEIVPYQVEDNDSRLAIVFRSEMEGDKLQAHIDSALGIIKGQGVEVIEIRAGNTNPLAKLYELFYIADFASYYAALLLDRDPSDIANIDELKKQITK